MSSFKISNENINFKKSFLHFPSLIQNFQSNDLVNVMNNWQLDKKINNWINSRFLIKANNFYRNCQKCYAWLLNFECTSYEHLLIQNNRSTKKRCKTCSKLTSVTSMTRRMSMTFFLFLIFGQWLILILSSELHDTKHKQNIYINGTQKNQF